MPRAKFASDPVEDYRSLRSEGLRDAETNDCSVIALMKVTGVSYEVAHTALAAAGRKNRRGAFTAQTVKAAVALGFKVTPHQPSEFISRYPGVHSSLRTITSHHPHRFNKVWADGKNYLMTVRGHVFATINGTVEDWAKQRCKRVVSIYEISKEN